MATSPVGTGRFAVLDVETTTLEAGPLGRVIEIGIVELEATRAPDGHLVFSDPETWQRWSTLVNPGISVGVGPTNVHGIELDHVRHAPRFREIIGDVLTRLDGAVVVAHHARFDLGFLDYECAFAGIELPTLAATCTRDLARHIAAEAHEPAGSFQLSACCERAGINFPKTDQHAALGDACVTAQLFVHLMHRAETLHLEVRTLVPPAALTYPQPSGQSTQRPSAPTRLTLPFDTFDGPGR